MSKFTWMMTAVLAMSAGHALAARNYCGDLGNAYGPFDYRSADSASARAIVTGAHFTEDVQMGVRGTTGPIGGDLDYTLRAIPNHPGALSVMANVALLRKAPMLQGAKYPVECYFERAMRFQPDDGAVRAAYGVYLYGLGKNDQALKMFADAAELSPDDAAINYNLGLQYLKMKDYDHSLVYAQKAYALGFPLPGLKMRLTEAGKWVEPAPLPVPAADGAAGAAGAPAAGAANAGPAGAAGAAPAAPAAAAAAASAAAAPAAPTKPLPDAAPAVTPPAK